MKPTLLILYLLATLPAHANAAPAFVERTAARIGSFKEDAQRRYDEFRRPKLNFNEAFPKAIYKKSYFGVALVGTTMVGAGVVSYFTAGAGAPAAATGVSTVATWVAGGGQGAYMAGLSTIGGWFGGNAMLGSAILNGVSLGLGGGSAAFATLSPLAKAGVVANLTASALDGVMYVTPSDTEELGFRVSLPLPRHFCGEHLSDLCERRERINAGWLKAENEYDKAKLSAEQEVLERNIRKTASDPESGQWRADEQLALAVLAHQIGAADDFDRILARLPEAPAGEGGYLHYLRAVSCIGRGDMQCANAQLTQTWEIEPYNLEAPMLLIHLLNHRGFEQNQSRIRQIAAQAIKDFDEDKYQTSLTPVSLEFRLATLHYQNSEYGRAAAYYESALKQLSLMQRYVLSTPIRTEIQLGLANTLYAEGNVDDAETRIWQLLAAADGNEAKRKLKSRYAGEL